MKYCPCGGYTQKQRSGPTGRKLFMLLVNGCVKCGRVFPAKELNDYKQICWVVRFNNKITKYIIN